MAIEKNESTVRGPRKLVGIVGNNKFWNYKPSKLKPNKIRDIANSYVEVFGMTGEKEWAESWNPADVSSMLRRDFSERPDIKPYCVTMEDPRSAVEGFAMGYSISTADIGPDEMPYNMQPDDKGKLQEDVKVCLRSMGVEKLLFFKDLGLTSRGRGGFEKIFILFKTMLELADLDGAEKILFWTSNKSRLYMLVKALGIDEMPNVGDGKDIVFLLGDLKEKIEVSRKPIADIIAYMSSQKS